MLTATKKALNVKLEPLRLADTISGRMMEVALGDTDTVVAVDIEKFSGETGSNEDDDDDALCASQEDEPW